jgi:hypothetical protein
VAAVTVLALAAAVVDAADRFAPAPTLEAVDVAPAALVKGPKHELGPKAKGDGFLVSFKVKSEYGTWDAIDLEMLDVRVKEVYSLDKLSAARKALFVNRNFTPTLQTELADAIAALGGAAGKSLLVSLAAEAETEGDARYIRRCVQMLVAGAKDVGGRRAFTTSRNEIEAVAHDLRVVLPWAVGYMTWNAETVPVMTAPVQAATAREVRVSGVGTDQSALEREAEGLRASLAKLERGEPILPEDAVVVSVSESVIKEFLDAQLPFEADADKFEVKLTQGEAVFRGSPAVQLATVALDHVDLVQMGGLEKFVPGGSLNELARTVRKRLEPRLPVVQIPVKIEQSIELPSVTHGPVLIQGACMPLEVSVAEVFAARGVLWVAVRVVPGELAKIAADGPRPATTGGR